eukprot:GHVP01000141.1.p1 GENE.GHVP01000141.1~~GHVP01000141.1.p1  ORF type:complete len:375 (+),score=55.59 GHVP01000141.1:217-1341(+)
MFWKNEDVLKSGELVSSEVNEEIRPLEIDKISSNPVSLPEELTWDTIDINSNEQLVELGDFLSKNYVEDKEGEFRFNYRISFLRWLFKGPNMNGDFLVCIRKAGRIYGFIAAMPTIVKIKDKVIKTVEIDFLCVSILERKNGLAPRLIKEVNRRVNKTGIGQGIYTISLHLSKPFTCARYFHKMINIPKLVSLEFTSIPNNITLEQYCNMKKLDKRVLKRNFRETNHGDKEVIMQLLNDAESKWDVQRIFSESELEYLFCTQGEVKTIISEEQDVFVSFFVIPTAKTSTDEQLVGGYLHYYASKSEDALLEGIQASVVEAERIGVDVFNALSIADCREFMEKLDFIPGSGVLNYYIYNWKVSEIPSSRVLISLF